MTTAERLHLRLKALGCDVYLPKRIWIGRATDNADLWRWEAGERISKGGSSIGSSQSMRECLAMSDDELKISIDHSAGQNHFYPHYDLFAAACRRLKLAQQQGSRRMK